MADYLVLGASGHAKVVASAIRAGGGTLIGALDDDPGKWGKSFCGVAIAGPLTEVIQYPQALVVAAIGENRARAAVVSRLQLVRWGKVIHPAAWVDPSAEMDEGAVIFAGAVVQVDSRIGVHAIVNTGASVDHDCVIGAFAHLAPGTHLAGDVRVGEGAFLGVGVSVIPGVCIGPWATVGAGAVVVRDVPDSAVVAGVPSRPLKPHKELR